MHPSGVGNQSAICFFCNDNSVQQLLGRILMLGNANMWFCEDSIANAIHTPDILCVQFYCIPLAYVFFQSKYQGLSLFDELPVAPRWRQSSAKAPRRLHEATMAAPRATTEAPRRLHEAAAKPSEPRRFHEGLVNAP